ncbi:MAG TPA: hypothetical protein VLF17_06435 [Candidatus Nitrosotenuis sp.]|nr:hypothetical protein [Candidatus Nitrosotenuis sp.]
MQYFQALQVGKKRVQASRDYLNKLLNNRAMPALALRDTKSDVWEPVGEENYYAVVDESSGFVLTDTSGYIVAICDSRGFSKALVQGVTPEQKDQVVKEFEKDSVPQFKGKVVLPV